MNRWANQSFLFPSLLLQPALSRFMQANITHSHTHGRSATSPLSTLNVAVLFVVLLSSSSSSLSSPPPPLPASSSSVRKQQKKKKKTRANFSYTPSNNNFDNIPTHDPLLHHCIASLLFTVCYFYFTWCLHAAPIRLNDDGLFFLLLLLLRWTMVVLLLSILLLYTRVST